MATVRAVYEHGVLRLLDPVQLSEGQEVKLTILAIGDSVQLTRKEIDRRLRAAGMWVEYDADDWFDEDDDPAIIAEIKAMTEEELEAELERIGKLFTGERSSTELIDEDRGEY